nr:Maf family nucleotide pyrophosphatase [Candidatus Sigynarchaeota archaeon]
MIDCYILGSQSNDRKELMEKAGLVPFIVLPSDYPEKDEANEPTRLAEIHATKKAQVVIDKFRLEMKKDKFRASLPIPKDLKTATFILITADTIVSLKSEVIGKAEDEAEAISILRRLAGQTHKLITAYRLAVLEVDMASLRVEEKKSTINSSVTRVKFDPMDDDHIRAYVKTGEWKGRAGCYAIQLRASQFVRSIDGSHSGVIGLPVSNIVTDLRTMGLDV